MDGVSFTRGWQSFPTFRSANVAFRYFLPPQVSDSWEIICFLWPWLMLSPAAKMFKGIINRSVWLSQDCKWSGGFYLITLRFFCKLCGNLGWLVCFLGFLVYSQIDPPAVMVCYGHDLPRHLESNCQDLRREQLRCGIFAQTSFAQFAQTVCPCLSRSFRVVLVALILILKFSGAVSTPHVFHCKLKADPSIFGCSHKPCDLGRGYDSRPEVLLRLTPLVLLLLRSALPLSKHATTRHFPWRENCMLAIGSCFSHDILLFFVKSQFLWNW